MMAYIREATSKAMNTTAMANPDAPEWCAQACIMCVCGVTTRPPAAQAQLHHVCVCVCVSLA
jgi:hypothetical protein